MDAIAFHDASREFTSARRTQGFVTARALSGLKNSSDSYRVQDQVRNALGAAVAGWKLARPPAADVISAPLFDIDCMTSNALVENTALLRDGVECELALRIDRRLPDGGCTREQVLAAVGAVMPAFELLCSRLPSGFASAREHIVADGLGHGAVVLGPPCDDWDRLDLEKLRVAIWADDRLVADKQASNPYGDPLFAVSLLAEHLAQRGRSIEPGSFVLAGSHTGVYRAQPGQRLRCLFEGVGEVAITIGNSWEQDDVVR